MRAFVWIVTTAIAAGCGCTRPNREMIPPVLKPPSQVTHPATPPSPVEELSGDQAWEAFQGGSLFLDARLPSDHWLGHIPSAQNLPVWAKDFESRLLDFLTGPLGEPEKPVVVYCGGCCSTDSLLLARRLQAFGFKHIQIYRDGYPGWARAGRPIEVGNTPKQSEVK
jgi:rhodanese-related sulfurtransferase